MFKNKQVQKHYKRRFWSTEKKTDFRDVSTSAINGQIEVVLGKRE